MMHEKHNPVANRALLYLLLLLIAIVYLTSINGNHRWWGDFSLFLSHARNIATAQPYAATNYIPNPDNAWISPASYPPVYPMLLAPVYRFFDLNLYAAKALNLSFFIFSLWLFYYYTLTRVQSSVSQLGSLIVIAASPWFWDMRNLILADIPFMFFTLSTVIIADRLANLKNGGTAYWFVAILLGLSSYLAYATKSLGLALPVAIFLYGLFFNRSARSGSIVALAVFLLLYLFADSSQNVDKSYTNMIVEEAGQDFQQTTEPYLDTLSLLVTTAYNSVITHIPEYAATILGLWDNGISFTLSAIVTLITSALALTGYILLVRHKPSVGEIFVAVYSSILLAVPFFQGYRYLIPIVPFYILYIFKGGEKVSELLPARARPYSRISLITVLLLSYTGFYLTSSPSVSPGVKDADAIELYSYIKQHTPPDGTIITRYPRIFGLFIERASFAYSVDNSRCRLWNNFRKLGKAYLVYNLDETMADGANLRELIKSDAGNFSLEFENRSFRFYRIDTSAPLAGCENQSRVSIPLID